MIMNYNVGKHLRQYIPQDIRLVHALLKNVSWEEPVLWQYNEAEYIQLRLEQKVSLKIYKLFISSPTKCCLSYQSLSSFNTLPTILQLKT